jgi:hypothetical protein
MLPSLIKVATCASADHSLQFCQYFIIINLLADFCNALSHTCIVMFLVDVSNTAILYKEATCASADPQWEVPQLWSAGVCQQLAWHEVRDTQVVIIGLRQQPSLNRGTQLYRDYIEGGWELVSLRGILEVVRLGE